MQTRFLHSQLHTCVAVVLQADSTDAIASYLSRRYGLGGGLIWVGVLAFGVISEQLKTRNEVSSAVRNTRDVADTQEVRIFNNTNTNTNTTTTNNNNNSMAS